MASHMPIKGEGTMRFDACKRGAFAGIVALMTLAAIPLAAQDPKSDSPAARKTIDQARRVPPYFGQIGLSTEQREQIYKIREKRQHEILALYKQIEEIQGLEMTECEGVLTDAQKKLLAQRREAAKSVSDAKAAEKQKAKAKADEKAKTKADEKAETKTGS
jgi:hypothetical protein